MDQPRSSQGTFASSYQERRGEAIALRLPASLDAQVRAAAGWQSKADNDELRAWMQAAVKAWAEQSGWAERHSLRQAVEAKPPACYTAEQVRAAANRVAMTIQPRNRTAIVKAFDALLGELLANGD